MTSPLSRRLFLGSLIAASATSACANAPETSPRPAARPLNGRAGTAPDAERIIAEAKLDSPVSYLVADAKTGTVLEGRNTRAAMAPASIAKVPTTLFALDRLGRDHRFTTRLVADGPVSGGRVSGDLVLVGGGDPTLDTDGLAALARGLRQAGIREVSGRLRFFAGALPYQREITDGQPDYLGYNPAISGLNLNFNRVYFEWKQQGGGYVVTMDARSDKLRPQVRMASMEVAERNAPLYTWRDVDGTERWTVMRGALGKAGGRWLPVRHPDRYAAEVFRSLARAEGISMGEEAAAQLAPGGTVLASRQSLPLAEVARDMLEYSTNMTAEVLGLSASHAAGLKASAGVMNGFLAQKYGVADCRLVDHSGLGEASRVTAEDMVALLVGAGPGGALMPLMKDIPMRDTKGRPIKGHPVSVRAKTGTLNFVSTLAGYAVVPGGRVLAFAILTGDLKRRAGLSEDDAVRPKGAQSWNARSKMLQQGLIERWGKAFAA